MTKFYGAILAAGRGSRLRPITDDVPKPLVTWLDAPMIEHAFEAMKLAGAQRIGFNACHCAEEMYTWAEHHSVSAEQVVTEPSLLGTGGGMRGIASSLEILEGDDQILVAWNGDIIAEPDVGGLTEKLKQTDAAACLLLRQRDPTEAGIGVSDESDGRVVSLPGHDAIVHRHPHARGENVRDLGYCGIMAIRPEVLRQLPSNTKSCVFRELLGPLLAAGERVAFCEYEGFFSDLGTPDRFYQASLDALNADFGGLIDTGVYTALRQERGTLWVHRSAEVAASARIEGDVICGPGAKVGEQARLVRCQVTNSVVTGTVTEQLRVDGKSAPLLFDAE